MKLVKIELQVSFWRAHKIVNSKIVLQNTISWFGDVTSG